MNQRQGLGLLLRTGSEALWWKRSKNKESLFSRWIIKWETMLVHHGHSHKQAHSSSGLSAVSFHYFYFFLSQSGKHTEGFHFKALERMPCAFWLRLAFVQWTIKESIFFSFLSFFFFLFLNVKLPFSKWTTENSNLRKYVQGKSLLFLWI